MTTPTRIFDFLTQQVTLYPKPDAVANKLNGTWKKYSSQEFLDHADFMALGFSFMGVTKGTAIASVSNNRPEWNFTDMGILSIGAVHVAMYPNLNPSDYVFILNDCKAQYIFVSDQALFDKISAIKTQVPSLKELFSFNKISGCRHWTEILELGKKEERNKVNVLRESVKPEDLATLIYTSGTTGTPKGVMLSHHNLVSNSIIGAEIGDINQSERALSFLPLCHVFERMITYMYMSKGTSIYYAENMDTIGDNLKEVQPHIFTTVPRFLEKVYDKILAKANTLSGIKRAMFFWALELAKKFDFEHTHGFIYNLQLALANKLVFSKWRAALGGNVTRIVSGGAALQPRLARVFNAAKISVLEGYGLTETSPVVAVNFVSKPGCIKIGTVGPVIRDVEVKIAEDGEILVKGPNVMRGYYNRPDLTAEAIDKNSYFHTGDIGCFEGKFLKITDRKKEMFKTSGGKFIAPQLIENKMKESPYIEQIMVIGDGKKFPAALIVPAFALLKEKFAKENILFKSNEEILANATVTQLIQSDVERLNDSFNPYERIKKFKLLPKEWTIESNELTPTLKCKRKNIMAHNEALVEEIYRE